MNAQRYHPRQYVDGWGDVLQPAFDRPRAKPGRIAPFMHRDSPVLMPTKRPIGRRRFVE
jgi:hypothetical protein